MKLQFSTTVLILIFSASTHASEDFQAEKFHQDSCTGCHDSSVYTRKKRRVNSLSRLESQVRMCDANLGKKLFDNDIHSLTNYLNDNYYHFKQ
ncbi:MAG TPA: cytochrome c [Thiolapillus brandeum]|uniref:Cytochrome c n=1 Tax=Thiolapillus brandeum TaxID=1076588 RepID=A0A831NZ71_9GAMM|nr:cytochrome c [Thiolapillus brandeum]